MREKEQLKKLGKGFLNQLMILMFCLLGLVSLLGGLYLLLIGSFIGSLVLLVVSVGLLPIVNNLRKKSGSLSDILE